MPLMATARAIAHAVDVKAGYVPGHSDGVGYLLGMMAREANYDDNALHMLELAALMHDAGKLDIPDEILLAERKLTDAEFSVIQQHPVWSARMTRSLTGAEAIVPWVYHHHERYDGKGYPDGIRGQEIPWPSRMLLVADAFHVMTTDRPYQRSRTRVDALKVLEDGAGTQFCPIAVEILHSRSVWAVDPPDLNTPPVVVAPDYAHYDDEDPNPDAAGLLGTEGNRTLDDEPDADLDGPQRSPRT